MILKITIIPLLVALIGCSHNVTRINFSHDPVNVDQVEVFYGARPDCNFDIIGYLQLKGGNYSLNGILRDLRRDAAGIGATAVYVTQTKKLDIGEYLASALAIRCDPFIANAF